MLINSDSYFQALEDIKSRIHNAQHKAVLGVNREQIELFWNIGKLISENAKYGSNFIENLARDIKSDFPKAKGYSARNLRYMRRFAALVNDEEILQTVSAILSWSHNTHLLDKTITLKNTFVTRLRLFKTIGRYLFYMPHICAQGLILASS